MLRFAKSLADEQLAQQKSKLHIRGNLSWYMIRESDGSMLPENESWDYYTAK